MNIGVVIECFNPRRGGAEQWTWQFVQQLLARGHQVHVVSQQFAEEAGQLPIVPHALGRIPGRVCLAQAVDARLDQLSLDVVHDMGVGWRCDLFHSHDGSRFAQWEQKLRLLPAWARPGKRALTHLLPRYREFRRLMARQFANPDSLVLALSQMVARDYEHYHGVPRERIRLVYNGVDTQRFSPHHRAEHRRQIRARLGVADDEVLFLFVGHDFARKGLATAIRALGHLRADRRPVRLVVVGGKPVGTYKRLADRCGVRSQVVFAGSVADPIPYYAAADAYVLPTFYDPCSLGVLEAAASGLPSITTSLNGASELLTDGVDGYLLADPADDYGLAVPMQWLLDPVLRQRMGEAARQLALQHTLERNCDQIEAIYREIRD